MAPPDALSDIEKVPIDQNNPGPPPIEQSVDATTRGPVSGRSIWKPDSLEWRYTVPVGIAFIIMAIASEVISHHQGEHVGTSVRAMRLIHLP